MNARDPRLAAMEEWVALVSAFLERHPHGAELEMGGLEELMRRREPLVERIAAGGKMSRPEAEAALRLQILEEELQRRVQRDLERRRLEIEELDQIRHSLKGYGDSNGRKQPKPPHFIDTRS